MYGPLENQNKKRPRFLKNDLGDITEVCFKGGGGSSTSTTSYVQSPEERELMRKLMPIVDWIFPPGQKGRPREAIYSVPSLSWEVPAAPQVSMAPSSAEFQAYESQIAPSLWGSYRTNVEEPLISRFASTGSLGSPSGGVSGAAMNALALSREQAQKDISNQIMAPFVQQQTVNAGLQGTRFKEASQAASQQALLPWQEAITMRQYPFQIMPGMLGGTMPQPVTTTHSKSGGK